MTTTPEEVEQIIDDCALDMFALDGREDSFADMLRTLSADHARLREDWSTIYRYVRHHIRWTESNDMLPIDELLCGIGLLIQERDRLTAQLSAQSAEVERLQRAVERKDNNAD